MFALKLIFKNAFRHRLRTLLTIGSIVIALVAFGLLRTVVNAWYAGVEASSATRLVTRNAVSLAFQLPLAYKDKIRQVNGVTDVSWGSWFGGIYINEKNFFANFAVEPGSYLKLYPEYVIAPDEKAAFLGDRRGAAAGIKLARRFGWKTGDLVTLKGTVYPVDLDFVIRAIYTGKDKNTDESQFFFHWSYLDESVKKAAPDRAGQVGFFMEGISDPLMAPAVSADIDGMFKNSLAETITETEKSFQLSFISMTEALLDVIQIVSFVVIAIIMAVTANTMSMTVRERIGEYSILKTLGFGGWRIAGLIAGESLTIVMIGCALGIAFTYPAASAFKSQLGTYFPVFNIDKRLFLLYAAASALVGLVAALFPAWKAMKLPIAEGLRQIG
ncbi:MAG: FtsX-like permease family protein [Nitrospiraceae bacterium]|nr:FtsX-like permease family protein [Nitrospiraceae bacterium]